MSKSNNGQHKAISTSKMDSKHTSVVDRRLGTKDVNPLLKINYDGANYKDTKGPKRFGQRIIKG